MIKNTIKITRGPKFRPSPEHNVTVEKFIMDSHFMFLFWGSLYPKSRLLLLLPPLLSVDVCKRQFIKKYHKIRGIFDYLYHHSLTKTCNFVFKRILEGL